MNYINSIKFLDVEAKQIPCEILHEAPTTSTEGAVGMLGMNVDSESHDLYKCVEVNDGEYVWELVDSGSSDEETLKMIERLNYYGDKDIVPTESEYIVGVNGLLSVVDNVSVDTFVVPYTLSDGSLVNAIEDLRVIANTLIIPNTVNIIGGQCCAGIKEVIIPRSVKEIRGGAFQNSFITEIIIPKNVEKIYEFSFFDIAELKYVYFENDNVEFCYLNAFPENGDCIFGITDFSGDEPQTIVNPNLTFICNPGSTAEAYAKENGIKYAYDYIDPTIISGGSTIQLITWEDDD